MAKGDQEDPAILFGKAVATLHMGGSGRAVEAQRYLRAATQKAFAPAFTLNGLVLFQLLALHERGDLPAAERLSLDGAGRAVQATPAQLAAEAVQWWQRGAAFHDPEAMRLLGMAEARGLTGKRDLGAAASYWRDAAARGDKFARFELAKMYYEGIGVEADSEKAIEWFRQASDQGILRATGFLGAALMPKSITGDVDAAREAIRALRRVANESPELGDRYSAHWALGVYLSDAAPAAVRDPSRAVDHYRIASRAGMKEALKALARAFETGVGVEPDLVKAAGYLTLLHAHDPVAAEADLARISRKLTAAERDRVKEFRHADDPVSAAFRQEFDMSVRMPGKFKRVDTSLKPRAP